MNKLNIAQFLILISYFFISFYYSPSFAYSNKVVLYSKPGCPACAIVEQKLSSCHISYKNIPNAGLFLHKQGLYTVPQLYVNGQLIGGLYESTEWINKHCNKT